jgi:hypothetical protein
VPGDGAEVKETTMPRKTKRQYIPAEALAAHSAASKRTADAIYDKPAPKRYVVARIKLVTRLENVAKDINSVDICNTSANALDCVAGSWHDAILDIADDMLDEKE